jgi:hypothetical protein
MIVLNDTLKKTKAKLSWLSLSKNVEE